MNRKDKIKLHFNRSSSKYDEYADLQRKVADKLFSLISNKIRDMDNILDAGCGTGYMHELFRKNKYNNYLWQLDLSDKMCEIAKSYLKENRGFTICSDIEQISLKEDSFNHIISSLALQWTDYKISLANLYNVLQPDGYLTFSTFGVGTLRELSFCFNEIENISRVNSFSNKDEINQILIDIGFRDISIEIIEIINYYPDTMSIMHLIKNLGASNASDVQNYLTKNKLKMLESLYRINFEKDNILPVTWSIYLINARK